MRDDWSGLFDDAPGDRSRGCPLPDPPHYCPGCARPRASLSGLCPECGDRLKLQGYCSVCEGFWPLPEAESCPKHEIPLDPGPPAPSPSIAHEAPIDWVTVGTYTLPFQAEAARIRLDAEAIPTLLDGHRMATNAAYHLATGGVRLQVPRSLAQDARILLSQNWSLPADDEDTEDDLDWDDVAPIQDDSLYWRGVLVSVGVLLSLLVIVAGLIGLIRS